MVHEVGPLHDWKTLPSGSLKYMRGQVLYEVVLPLRVVPQPTPSLSPGGDCGACVLAGLLGTTVEEVYAQFAGGRADAPSRFEMENIVSQALRSGRLDRVVTGVPFWPTRSSYLAFGHSGHLSFPEWFEYVRMALDGGYYGISSVNFEQTGAGSDVPPDTDHVVLICGAREVSIPHEKLPASRIEREVLVSCSARSGPDLEWVEVKEFLAKRGGYNVILVRPALSG